ncbi:hypothetical protein GN958_ATG18839 [Phytophthora infestans]|uniref:Uncharacterized protein n=1 Tax=Phytophthora infestans TaxID=4787 RepID=A0A8S9TYQ3_PHYIN|nr:hypothetical protein GN958_ATG18839 [Phytophthora infestans]
MPTSSCPWWSATTTEETIEVTDVKPKETTEVRTTEIVEETVEETEQETTEVTEVRTTEIVEETVEETEVTEGKKPKSKESRNPKRKRNAGST